MQGHIIDSIPKKQKIKQKKIIKLGLKTLITKVNYKQKQKPQNAFLN